MAKKHDDELDWEKLKAGRLDEGESEARLLSGRGARTPPMVLRRTVFFAPRKVAMTREAPGLSFRAGPSTELAGRTTTAPFHMAHSFVSRARSRSTPRSVEKGSRVAVFPRKAEVADLRAQGGRYHSRHHVWTLPANSPFLKTKKGAAMRSIAAGYAHQRRRDGQGVAKHTKTIRLFQDYIERATMGEAQRAEEVEGDEKGLISIGNLGQTRAERQDFWAAVEAVEKRADARLQCRIIAELPYWIQPADRRAIVERFGAAFEARQLGWWAAVHRPDVAKGSDPRNFHLHLVYHDRSFLGRFVEFRPDKDGKLRALPGAPIFEKFKDREARGQAWIVEIKALLADIVNDVVLTAALRDGTHPVRLMFPGSYAELGIAQVGQRHLGPKRTALERVGVGTRTGLANLGLAEAEFAREDALHVKNWQMALRLLSRAERHLVRAERHLQRAERHLIGTERQLVGAEGTATSGERSSIRAELQDAPAENAVPLDPAIVVFRENLAQMLAEADAIVGENDAIMAAFSDAEIARIAALDAPEAQRAVEKAENRFGERQKPLDFSRVRIALRDKTFEKLLEKAKSDSAISAEISQRRDEMVALEGAKDVRTAARQRRLIEEEWLHCRSQIGAAAGNAQRVASRVAVALLALELGEQLAYWRKEASADDDRHGADRAAGPTRLEGLRMPYPISMPPEGAFSWANGYAAALGGPSQLRARWEGSEADWESYLIRRRLLELREAAKIFAAAPGVRRLYDPMFEASFGVSSAGLAAAFEKEEAAIVELLSGARKKTPLAGLDWDR